MALLRLLTNVRVMGSGTLRLEQACDAVGNLRDDPSRSRGDQVPQTHAKHWRANVAKGEPTPGFWEGGWLAMLAQSTHCEMDTFDRGFRSFAIFKPRLLSAAA